MGFSNYGYTYFIYQIFHEEMALQWIFTLGNSTTKHMVLKNSWFFFEMIVSDVCVCLSLTVVMECYSSRSRVWLSISVVATSFKFHEKTISLSSIWKT